MTLNLRSCSEYFSHLQPLEKLFNDTSIGMQNPKKILVDSKPEA